MARKGAGSVRVAIATLLCVGASSVWASTADAALTWEGTWETIFGDIEMDAGGSGTYPGGMITGTITGEFGEKNSGDWQEANTAGTYEFVLSSPSSFDGTYERTGGGCVFPPCDWDGNCIAGPCQENSFVDDEPCPAQPRAFAAPRLDCLYRVPFNFELKSGRLPSSTPASDLPRNLTSIEANTDGAKIFFTQPDPEGSHARGKLEMTTRYRKKGGDVEKREITFRIGREGLYERQSPFARLVGAEVRVIRSNDKNCPEGLAGAMTLKYRNDAGGKVIKLKIVPRPDDVLGAEIPCLTDEDDAEPLVWTTGDFKSAKIGLPQLVSADSG